jgi:hemerythrin-like domain-containing protein
MIPLETLKQQHKEICELINVLSLLVHDERARKSRIAENLFSELAKMVSEHLMLEDSTLYKELLVHQDSSVQLTAKNFLSGSHELKRLFSNYMKYACRSSSKQEDCEAFINETEEVFKLLKKRITMEENKFYPLVEKA